MKRNTILTIQAMKSKDPISMLTAYDAPTAKVVDQGGVDMILVGDSLGNVVLGHENTLRVTLNNMIYHGQAVMRGSQQALVVVDMPFGSYQISTEKALHHAASIIAQTGAQAVKLEGGSPVTETIAQMVSIGIPVMGHLGLTPQSVHQMGGYRMQGKTPKTAQRIYKNALNLEKAGVFALVLECIPDELAKQISQALTIPTIGIGSGKHTDGQVLVFHDWVGFTDQKIPSFVSPITNIHKSLVGHVETFVKQTKDV